MLLGGVIDAVPVVFSTATYRIVDCGRRFTWMLEGNLPIPILNLGRAPARWCMDSVALELIDDTKNYFPLWDLSAPFLTGWLRSGGQQRDVEYFQFLSRDMFLRNCGSYSQRRDLQPPVQDTQVGSFPRVVDASTLPQPGKLAVPTSLGELWKGTTRSSLHFFFLALLTEIISLTKF